MDSKKKSKKSLLWVGNIGDYSSFSRITASVLSQQNMLDSLEISLLTAARNKIPNNLENLLKRVVRLGSDTDTVSWEEFKYSWDMSHKSGIQNTPSSSPECHMKYSLIQIADLIFKHQFDYLLICNGIYEASWFIETILASKLEKGSILNPRGSHRTEIIIWTPIDYVPTFPVVRWILEADYLFTMTPVMVTELEKMNEILLTSKKTRNKVIDWVGHGSDIKDNSNTNRTSLINKLNKLKGPIWNGQLIEPEDIIILNANNCVSRKRLDLTLGAFYELLKTKDKRSKKRLKLWIHTDIKKFAPLAAKYGGKLGPNIIVSNNTVSDSILNMIYQVSQIGLQTSTGEGFSLTNCEHAMTGALQVVPDFLATGFHFKDNRGILIPVTETKSKNEADHNVIIGVPSVRDISDKLIEAVEIVSGDDYDPLVHNKKSIEYAKSYTWLSISEKLLTFI